MNPDEDLQTDQDFRLSREDLLAGGLPGRPVSALLFAIESRTAFLKSLSNKPAAPYLTGKTAQIQEEAYLEALRQGRNLPKAATIQDLERHAPAWADLAPGDAMVTATLARLIGEKYRFTRRQAPRLRQALRMDDPRVAQAFQAQHGFPLESVYARRLPIGERLRWLTSGFARRLEELPPFWVAFALTLTETVGAAILALPIALAGMGAIAGIVQLLILGLVNVLTIAAVSETLTRNGNVRYGSSFFGQLVGDYLGKLGTLIFTFAFFVLNSLAIVALYTGLSTSLAAATPVPDYLWAVLLFLVVLYYLRRQSLDATIATALVIGFVNIGLILTLALLAIPHVRPEYLLHTTMPSLKGAPLDSGLLGLVFGVILTAYFGHTSIAVGAKVVLRRDPSGKSMLWGNVTALLAAALLYCVWILAINGAIPPEILASASGTVLPLLAEKVGPVVFLIGSAYVILGMGMAVIHFSLGLFNQMREWLPLPPGDSSQAASPAEMKSSFRSSISGKAVRFAAWMTPLGVTFAAALWLLWTGRQSFTGMLSFLGVITVPLLAGVFPVLLLAASRRKGDYVPGVAWRFLGNPVVLGIVYSIFLVSIFLHGLVIWQDPFLKAAALFVGILLLVATVVFIRQGAFKPRLVVELRLDESAGHRAYLNLTRSGHAWKNGMRLVYHSGEEKELSQSGEIEEIYALQAVRLELAAGSAREIKVWAHRVTAEGISLPLPRRLAWQNGVETHKVEAGDLGVLSLPPGATSLEISL